MRMWLDTEFNEYRGQTISVGIVTEDDRKFYEVLEMCETPTKWVAENVMPVLGQFSVNRNAVQRRLFGWLNQFDSLQIYVDHIADGQRFFKLLETDEQGGYLDVPTMTIRVVKNLPGTQRDFSKTEHNALSDAIALRERYQMKAVSVMDELDRAHHG